MIEINYHLAEAFLISKRPDLAQGYLDAAMALVSERRGGGEVIEESLVQRIREATGRAAEMQKKKDAKEGGA
jgi:hypothetical protein